MALIFHVCPTCGAKEREPCRTPKGKIKKSSVHDTRPFSVTTEQVKPPDRYITRKKKTEDRSPE